MDVLLLRQCLLGYMEKENAGFTVQGHSLAKTRLQIEVDWSPGPYMVTTPVVSEP